MKTVQVKADSDVRTASSKYRPQSFQRRKLMSTDDLSESTELEIFCKEEEVRLQLMSFLLIFD